MNFNKKYVVICVTVLLLFFGMNRCTVACNRSKTITKQEVLVDSLKTCVNDLNIKVDMLEKDTTYLRSELNELGVTNKDLIERVSKQQVVHNHYERK